MIATEYAAWNSMKQRCLNPKNKLFPDYGQRGIKICERWMKYANFIEDMGAKPDPKLTLDRIDNNGNYDPGNCRWATMKEQSNNRRSNKLITYDGRTQNWNQWATELNIKKTTFNMRIKRGWTIENIVKNADPSYRNDYYTSTDVAMLVNLSTSKLFSDQEAGLIPRPACSLGGRRRYYDEPTKNQIMEHYEKLDPLKRLREEIETLKNENARLRTVMSDTQPHTNPAFAA